MTGMFSPERRIPTRPNKPGASADDRAKPAGQFKKINESVYSAIG
jgi:hypothetical protein